MTTQTAQQITDNALDYNAEYPEAAAEINTGTPVISVFTAIDDAYGKWMRVVVTHGIRLADGGFAAAEDPTVHRIRLADGRLSRIEAAKRFSRRIGVADAAVAVEWRDDSWSS